MTKKILLVLAGMLIGCAAAVGMETVSAQNNDMTFADPAAQTAQTTGQRQYRECFAASVDFVSGRHLNAGRMPEITVRVPEGWTPVGGIGNPVGGGGAGMILCR